MHGDLSLHFPPWKVSGTSATSCPSLSVAVARKCIGPYKLHKTFPPTTTAAVVRALNLALLAVLLLAGCSAPDKTESDQTAEPTRTSTLEPSGPTSTNPLEPLNATFSGHFEFAAGFESPLLDGCTGHNISSVLLTGNSLTLTVPSGYQNGTATAVVSSNAPLGSFRLCLNEEDGTNIATVTGAAPLHMDFTPRPGELHLFLFADNTQPSSPSANADFTLTLEVTA